MAENSHPADLHLPFSLHVPAPAPAPALDPAHNLALPLDPGARAGVGVETATEAAGVTRLGLARTAPMITGAGMVMMTEGGDAATTDTRTSTAPADEHVTPKMTTSMIKEIAAAAGATEILIIPTDAVAVPTPMTVPLLLAATTVTVEVLNMMTANANAIASTTESIAARMRVDAGIPMTTVADPDPCKRLATTAQLAQSDLVALRLRPTLSITRSALCFAHSSLHVLDSVT